MAAGCVEGYTCPMTENATPSSDWLDRFFESYYEHRPVNATFVGRHHLDHMLPDLSEDGAGDALADMDALLRESSQVDENGLSSVERLDLRLARGFLGIQGWEYRSHHFHGGNPSVYTGEAVFGLMSLFLSGFAPLSERMASAVERLRAVPTLLASCMANVREAPREWTARAVRECDGGLAFLEHGMPRLIAESGVDSSGMEPALAMAAKSFADLRSWLETELGRRGVDRHACGEEALERYVRQGHFLRRSLDEIVAYAKEEKAEASGRLERLTRELGHADVDSAWAALARRHPTTDAYYEAYATMWDHMRATAEAHHLLTWPDFPIRYAPRPEWTREAAPYLYFLFYRSPAAFDRPPVHDYLVTPIEESMPVDEQERLLRASNDSVIKLNHVVHHGGIGHVPYRDVLRRHDGRGVGVLRHGPHGGVRWPDSTGASGRAPGADPHVLSCHRGRGAAQGPVLHGAGDPALRAGGRHVGERSASRGGEEQHVPGGGAHVPDGRRRHPRPAARDEGAPGSGLLPAPLPRRLPVVRFGAGELDRRGHAAQGHR